MYLEYTITTCFIPNNKERKDIQYILRLDVAPKRNRLDMSPQRYARRARTYGSRLQQGGTGDPAHLHRLDAWEQEHIYVLG